MAQVLRLTVATSIWAQHLFTRLLQYRRTDWLPHVVDMDAQASSSADTPTVAVSAVVHDDDNSTAHDYVFYGQWSVFLLAGVGIPVEVFGLIANILSIRIFTHRVMRRTPINWCVCCLVDVFTSSSPLDRYLAVLSTSDFFICLTSMAFLSLPRLGQFTRQWWIVYAVYYLTPVPIFPLSRTVQTISVYMTVMMSTHRLRIITD